MPALRDEWWRELCHFNKGKKILDAADQAATFARDDAKRREAITSDIEARIRRAIRGNIVWRSRPRGVVASVSDRRAK
ncbi:MAG: hypothetical protein DLM68_18410 [Hyphomicrobiales bacterium]|nr:MAG: hypothetical protein DLM68_18410 [Hyphomicrobiales bacterium]